MDTPNDTDDPEQHYDRGCESEECENAEGALAAYRRCLASNPDHLDARINCGRLLHLAGQLGEAEGIYRAARRIDGTLLFNLAVLLQDQGRDGEAAQTYREALDADPDLADAHYNLACLYEEAGNTRDCIRHLMAYRRIVRD